MPPDLNNQSLVTIDTLINTHCIPIPKSAVYRLASRGLIRAYKPGKEWLFDVNEVLEDIKRNFKNGHTEIQKKPKPMVGGLSHGWR